jgi:hypothetical protein
MAEQLISNWIGVKPKVCKPVTLQAKFKKLSEQIRDREKKPKWTIVSLIIQIVVAAVVLAPLRWIVEKWFVGKDKANFTDAVWIGVLGVVIGAVIGFFPTGIVGTILGTLIMIVVWLALITHFFDCGLLKGLVIAIIAGIIYWVISLILSAILIAL